MTEIPLETEIRYRKRWVSGLERVMLASDESWTVIRGNITPPLTISNLEPDTEYECQARHCYPEEYGGACSEWTKPLYFKTKPKEG